MLIQREIIKSSDRFHGSEPLPTGETPLGAPQNYHRPMRQVGLLLALTTAGCASTHPAPSTTPKGREEKRSAEAPLRPSGLRPDLLTGRAWREGEYEIFELKSPLECINFDRLEHLCFLVPDDCAIGRTAVITRYPSASQCTHKWSGVCYSSIDIVSGAANVTCGTSLEFCAITRKATIERKDSRDVSACFLVRAPS